MDIAFLLNPIQKLNEEYYDDLNIEDEDGYLQNKGVLKQQDTYPVERSKSKFPIDKAQKEINFKKWFGNSKVVDSNGNPLVVYHGSTSFFRQFYPSIGMDIGSHFGDTKASHHIIGKYDDNDNIIPDTFDDKGSIYPVYLRIENPLQLKDNLSWDIDEIGPELVRKKILSRDDYKLLRKHWSVGYNDYLNRPDKDKSYKNDDILFVQTQLIKAIKSKGYDGIKYVNRVEGIEDTKREMKHFEMSDEEFMAEFSSSTWSWIIFDPNQAKSIYNVGTFDNTSDLLTENAQEYKDNVKYYNLNDGGRATISVGNNAYTSALISNGLRRGEEKDLTDSELEWFNDDYLEALKQPNEIHLVDWRADTPKSGFGRKVLQLIFKLADKYNLNSFHIPMPSENAKQVLQHFENKGYIRHDPESMRGLSVDQYPTHYVLLNYPE